MGSEKEERPDVIGLAFATFYMIYDEWLFFNFDDLIFEFEMFAQVWRRNEGDS